MPHTRLRLAIAAALSAGCAPEADVFGLDTGPLEDPYGAWHLAGSATREGDVVVLTDGTAAQTGGMWFMDTPYGASGWELRAWFKVTDPDDWPADGWTITWMDETRAVGHLLDGGGALGVALGADDGQGWQDVGLHGWSVEVDLYQNIELVPEDIEPDVPHVAVFVDGGIELPKAPPVVLGELLDDGIVREVLVRAEEGKVTVSLDGRVITTVQHGRRGDSGRLGITASCGDNDTRIELHGVEIHTL